MASESPCTMSTRAPLAASASTTPRESSLELAVAVAELEGGDLTAFATAVLAAVSTSLTPPVAAASTTRTMPVSQPVTADGRRYPSTHVVSVAIATALPRPTADVSPLRQKSTERTSLRRNSVRNGLDAYAATAVPMRPRADASAATTRTGAGAASVSAKGRRKRAPRLPSPLLLLLSALALAMRAGATSITSSTSPAAAAMAAARPPMECPMMTLRHRSPVAPPPPSMTVCSYCTPTPPPPPPPRPAGPEPRTPPLMPPPSLLLRAFNTLACEASTSLSASRSDSRSATPSMARAMRALCFGVYRDKSAVLSVRPNPGESCATTVAFSAVAKGCNAARSHEYVLAPKPCTQLTTVAGPAGAMAAAAAAAGAGLLSRTTAPTLRTIESTPPGRRSL
mmetsp:Transcript_6837/g.16984  ORF Transcript_6837/g.16984 Transcript_6837/m.16984 type:complete len:396 (+) Transcript_6837:63-1250(+)